MPACLAACLGLGLGTAAAGEPREDVLRFANGDVIHGGFAGIQEGPRLLWEREDLQNPVAFEVSKLRQMVLSGGRARKPMSHPSHTMLVGGDCLPGRIERLDDNQLTLATDFAGTVTVPRDVVASLAPNPHGGHLHYSGPFSPDGWIVPEIEPAGDDAGNATPGTKGWLYAGAAFYSNSTLPLTRAVGMPDQARFRFEIAWRNRLNLAVAFHADFQEPEDAGKRNRNVSNSGHQSYPYLFGNAYVLTLYSNYAQLWRSGFDEDGKPRNPQRLQAGNTNVNFPEAGKATLELRCDRNLKTISLFVDGEFALQWDDPDLPYAGTGGGIGFVSANDDSSQVRVSEIVVSAWNGVMDSARSMESPALDVVMLINGMDRFSGSIREISEGNVTLSGSYAEMRIPLEEIAEIHFARDRRRAGPDRDARDAAVRFHPVGRISGRLLRSDGKSLDMDSRILGPLAIDLAYPLMFDFESTSSFLDEWNEAF